MAPNRFDGEIGRGRQRSGDESGSSRESSSERPTSNRIASPPLSEDGDTRMQSVADDDTPPPASRPLIRQALGFSSAQPQQSITTYQAVPEIAPARSVFLPGQEVPIPRPTLPIPPVQGEPVTTPLKPGRPPKKPKRSKRPEAYPGQTSRFRVEAITPASNAEPSANPGADPYASAHRGLNSYAPNSSSSDSLTATSTANSVTANSSNPIRSATIPSIPPNPPTRGKAPAAGRAGANRSPAAPLTTAQKNRLKYDAHLNDQRNLNFSGSSANAVQHQASTSHPAPSANRRTSAPPTGGTSSEYYRYEHPHENRSPPQYRERDYPQGYGNAPTSSNYVGYSGDAQAQRRPSNRQPLRMVTLLIQDLRSGTVDHQLAEVKVPLKESDNPKDAGFWADAQDITQQLQSGPCRIDGPARAYTLRGKYRQFLLRVSANNVDEYMSANVVVHEDRTLDVVVEMLPPPGAPPPAPKIPPDIIGPNYDYDNRQGLEMDVDSHQGSHSTLRENRKRINSPSFDDYDNPHPDQSSQSGANKAPRYSYYHHRTHEQSPSRGSPHYPGRSGMESPDRGRRSITLDHGEYTFPGPTSMTPQRSTRSLSPRQRSFRDTRTDHSDDESTSSVSDNEKFIAAVSKILEADPSWVDFFKARATQKVANVIKEYEFVKKQCNALRGTSVPGFSELIRDEHILKALKVDENIKYLEACNETMELYLLYGKQGRHHEDPRVMEMMNDNTPPKAGSNLHKRILHLLQDLDRQYRNANGQTEGPRTQPLPPPPSQPTAPGSDTNQSDPRQGPRGTKGMFV